MINIIPLQALSSEYLDKLRNIYANCVRTDRYENILVARNTNVFIDDESDYQWILKHILLPIGILQDDIENLYKQQNCAGINFNVLTSVDWVNQHSDINPCKLNILISSEKISNIRFISDNEEWNYETPAILDVSKNHLVTNLDQLTEPRIVLQVFLTKPFEYYRDHVKTAPALRPVKPIFSVDEISRLFDHMTAEVFDRLPELHNHGSMMVHLFPNLNHADGHDNIYKNLLKKPKGHSKFCVKDVIEISTGTLRLCHQTFLAFGTEYTWYQFEHNDCESYASFVQDKLSAHGMKPVEEWWLAYYCQKIELPEHVDGLAPWTRYSFVVKQADQGQYLKLSGRPYHFKQGDAYVMDADYPHKVVNQAETSRIMLLGALDTTNGCEFI